MAKVLADLLGKTEVEFDHLISKLEATSGYESLDVRLLARNSAQLRTKLSQLGLDPDDTTGQELYHALLARYSKDAALLDKSLGVSAESSVQERLKVTLRLLDHVVENAEVWAPKATVVKALLLKNVPKKTMKLLAYRSIDSMLKREEIAAILLAAAQIESSAWQKSFSDGLAKTASSGFELRPAKIIQLKKEQAESLKLDGLVTAEKNSGTLALYSGLDTPDLPVLSIALLILNKLEGLSVRFNFKAWANVHPTLRWWADTEHLLYWNQGQPISLNLKDVALESAGQNSTDHASRALWAKLIDAYKEKIENLPENLSQLEYDVQQSVDKLASPVKELATEAVEI